MLKYVVSLVKAKLHPKGEVLLYAPIFFFWNFFGWEAGTGTHFHFQLDCLGGCDVKENSKLGDVRGNSEDFDV